MSLPLDDYSSKIFLFNVLHGKSCSTAWRSLLKNQTGTYSPKPDIRDVTLIENEVLEALAVNQPPLQDKPIILKPIEHRRNLTTSGVPLNYLVGKKFKVGDVILLGGRLNFPCKYLADLLKKPLVLPLYNRSGLNCSIIKGGIIRKGDNIIQIED